MPVFGFGIYLLLFWYGAQDVAPHTAIRRGIG